MRALFFGLLLAAGLGFVSAREAAAFAGPRYIIVHGGGLAEPILLDDLPGNELLVSAIDLLPRAGVPREADRPVYELALFFIVPDLTGRTPADLTPAETGATGRFFPAVGELEAIFEIGAVPGIGPRRDAGLTPTMLDYLDRWGVPVVSDLELGPARPAPTAGTVVPSVPFDPGREGPPAWTWVAASSGGLLLVALLVLLSRRRKPRRHGIHF